MAGEPVSAYTYHMAQMRISQLEIENKMLQEQLKAYELKHGGFDATTPPPQTAPAMVLDQGSGDSLSTARMKAMDEKEEASKKFMALMLNYQKLLIESTDEDMSTEGSFSLSSPLTTEDIDLCLDSPTFSPINTQ